MKRAHALVTLALVTLAACGNVAAKGEGSTDVAALCESVETESLSCSDRISGKGIDLAAADSCDDVTDELDACGVTLDEYQSCRDEVAACDVANAACDSFECLWPSCVSYLECITGTEL